MTKVSILYPHTPGARFDFDYYLSKHMPRSIELLSTHPGFRRVTVEQGVSGTEPDSPPAYVAACFYTFDSVESFVAAFMPHAQELQAEGNLGAQSRSHSYCFAGAPVPSMTRTWLRTNTGALTVMKGVTSIPRCA